MKGEDAVLVVDDDDHIREVVRFALTNAGFRVIEARNGKEALDRFHEKRPDLLVLDILMPELDGIEVCRTIRLEASTPIVFLSSRDEEVDRILGLELGGDDYVTKPFSPRELVARVKAVLRRGGHGKQQTHGSAPVCHGRLKLDLDAFEAYWGDRKVTLTVTEFGVIRALLATPGKVFTRDELMDRAYSFDNIVTDRTIDSHVRRVRKKFAQAGGAPIETVHGVGYKLGDCLQDE